MIIRKSSATRPLRRRARTRAPWPTPCAPRATPTPAHSYGHLTYGDISPERLAGDAQKWNDQIAAVIGETDVLLYPFGSDIAGVEAYKGAKFDTLYGLGFRYFCNVDSAEHWVQIHDGYVRQGRRNIDGYRMYYQSNLLDDLFDTKTVRRPCRRSDRQRRKLQPKHDKIP